MPSMNEPPALTQPIRSVKCVPSPSSDGMSKITRSNEVSEGIASTPSVAISTSRWAIFMSSKIWSNWLLTSSTPAWSESVITKHEGFSPNIAELAGTASLAASMPSLCCPALYCTPARSMSSTAAMAIKTAQTTSRPVQRKWPARSRICCTTLIGPPPRRAKTPASRGSRHSDIHAACRSHRLHAAPPAHRDESQPSAGRASTRPARLTHRSPTG